MITTAREFRVGNLMTIDPVVIDPEATASEAEQLLKTYRVTGLPVVSGRAVVGVISQTDLLAARSSDFISGHWDRLRVRHLMTTPAVVVHATTSIEHAARQMVSRHIHRLVVVDDEDNAIGVLSSLDLLRVLLNDPDVIQ